MKSTAPLLEMKNVTVMRGSVRALDRVALLLPAHTHVAILGPNGSGKSTLIHTLTRECYPLATEDHTLRVFGEKTWIVSELRTRLGIVSNDLVENCRRPITGEECVLSGFFSSIGLWSHQAVRPAMIRKARQVLRELGIGHLRDRDMDTLSSGEARRVLIARALVHDPRALLLDEPSNSLDPRAQAELTAFVRALARRGKAILMVTHHLPDILPEIDRVVMMKDGRVFRDGTKGKLLTERTLSELFGMRLRVRREKGFYRLS